MFSSEWSQKTESERKETFKILIENCIRCSDSHIRHPLNYLYSLLKPIVDNMELPYCSSLEAFVNEIVFIGIAKIWDPISQVESFAFVSYDAPKTNKIQQGSNCNDVITSKKANHPNKRPKVESKNENLGEKASHKLCFHCGRSNHSPEMCRLKTHPDANHDKSITWGESPAGLKWIERKEEVLPFRITLNGESFFVPKDNNTMKEKNGKLEYYVDIHDDKSTTNNLPTIYPDILIASTIQLNNDDDLLSGNITLSPGNCEKEPQSQEVKILLDSGALQGNYINKSTYDKIINLSSGCCNKFRQETHKEELTICGALKDSCVTKSIIKLHNVKVVSSVTLYKSSVYRLKRVLSTSLMCMQLQRSNLLNYCTYLQPTFLWVHLPGLP
jgi:hypothetical protein